MKTSSLENFIIEIKKVGGPLNTDTIRSARRLLEELVKTPTSEEWLSELLKKSNVNEELYRDPDHGYVLLAYSEKMNLYREPHNHGACWVLYAVQSGEMEMKTYKSTINQKGEMNLVCRESYKALPGDCRAFLPEDIHDTKCVSDSVLMFRLTSCDLKKEYREGRMIKYEDNSKSKTSPQ